MRWFGVLLARCRPSNYRPQYQPRSCPNQVREEYVVPALGIRNRHLYPLMHQISAWLPTLPVTSGSPTTILQERTYVHVHVNVHVHVY